MRRRFLDRSIRSRLARATLLVCAIACASLAVACGSDEPATPEPTPAPAESPATPAPPPGEPAPPATAAEEGEEDANAPESIVTEGALPEAFPKDVPVYAGATPGSSMTAPGLGVFTTFESDDEPEAILTHYRTELAKNGWSVVDTAQGDGVDGTKGGRTVQVRARPNQAEGKRTEIAVNVTGG